MGGQSGKIKTAKLWMRFIVIKMSGTLRKHLQDIVEHLIIAGEENDRVDFKETYYHENKKSDMQIPHSKEEMIPKVITIDDKKTEEEDIL